MAIPGTLEHEGTNPITQGQMDAIPNLYKAQDWIMDQFVPDDQVSSCYERIWDESGYDRGAVWFDGDALDTDPVASSLAAYGFDLYDQTGGKWYVFLPDDRAVE